MKNRTGVEHIGGFSASNGFTIKIKLENRQHDVRLNTDNYDRFASVGKFQWSFVFCLIAASLFSLPAIFLLEFILGGSGFAYYFGFFTIFISFSSLWELFWILIDRDKREWHACEHKVISLILSGESATMDNLRKAPKENFRCGTTQGLGCALFCLYYLSLAAIHRYIFIFDTLGFWLIAAGITFLYCIFICTVGTFLDQKFFTTLEPNLDKLEEVLKLAQEAEKIIKIG